MMTMATAAAVPPMVSSVRKGLRSMLRNTMRSAGGMRCTPRRSSVVRRYRPGAGGRMASAGARRTVAPTALSVPSSAVPPVTQAPTRISQGAMRCSNTGKKKNSM